MSVRTLPLRVPPLPGEALDSWLEAVAARHNARMGDLLHHVGIDERTRRWLVQLHQRELHSISTATGVAPDVVDANDSATVLNNRGRNRPDQSPAVVAVPTEPLAFLPAVPGRQRRALATCMAIAMVIRLHHP